MSRYTAVAIVLHWAIAAAIVANIALGWWMQGAIDGADSRAGAVAAFQVHKSIGLTVLALSLLRLTWRLTHRPPPLPATMPAWEKRTAAITHWAFYALMVLVPLTGWLYVSTQWRGGAPLQVPTLWFGLFEVPHLLGLDKAAPGLRQTAAGISGNAHWYLAWSMAGLLVLHIAAALKHRLIDRDSVLARMVPILARDDAGRGNRARRYTLRAGMASIAVAAVAIAFTQFGATQTVTPAEGAQPTITAAEDAWAIEPARSHIRFSGVHAGNAFTGRFSRWRANIRIDTDDVSQSNIAARIATASAADGVPLHDKTLPGPEWFHADKHPYARYRARRIRAISDGRYAVAGTLTIKNRTIDVPRLTLTVNADRATLKGTFTIDRKAANLGMESDPNGQWVSRKIEVEARASVTRPP